MLHVTTERTAIDVVADRGVTETGGESCKSPGRSDSRVDGRERQSDKT